MRRATVQNVKKDLREGGCLFRSCSRANSAKGGGNRALLGGLLAMSLLVCVAGWPVCPLAAEGDLKWAYTTGGSVSSSPAIAPNGTIYAGSSDNKLYAINPNGTLKWTYTTRGSMPSSPALASDGTIYVGSEDHKLYALYGRSKLASTAWPMFHHDGKHTGRKP